MKIINEQEYERMTKQEQAEHHWRIRESLIKEGLIKAGLIKEETEASKTKKFYGV